MQAINVKCISVNQRPNGTAMVSFTQSGKEENKPAALINVEFRDAAKAKEFEHMKDYTIDIKPKK